MSAVTAATLIRTAMQDLGVLAGGESPTGTDLQDARRRLNLMLGNWAVQALTVPYIAREVFTPTANVSTYTIGDGGTFDTTRPQGQNSIQGCGLILQGTSPAVEIPRTVFTYDGYEAINIKSLSNTLWTGLLYRPTYPLGTIVLWPVPSQVNDVVLYLSKTLSTFADLTTSYDLPDGAEEAIQTNLTKRLAPMFAVSTPPEILEAASRSFAAMKRNNVVLSDVQMDPMFTSSSRPGSLYNINSGSNQRTA